MVERACLRLTQDARCSACGGGTVNTEIERDGRPMIESICTGCNAYRIDPKEPLEQAAAPFAQLLLQSSLTAPEVAC